MRIYHSISGRENAILWGTTVMNPVNGEMMREMQSLGYAAQFAVAKPLYSCGIRRKADIESEASQTVIR